MLSLAQGTMNAFSVMGPNAASWKPLEGKHASMFGVEEGFDQTGRTGADAGGGGGAGGVNGTGSNMLLNADLAAATNALRNVTITKAKLLQSYNTFGVPLGVTVSCLPRLASATPRTPCLHYHTHTNSLTSTYTETRLWILATSTRSQPFPILLSTLHPLSTRQEKPILRPWIG